MIVTVLQFVVPAVGVLTGIIYTQRQLARAAARAATVENRKVDADAYERARKFDQSVVDSVRAELDRARVEIREIRAELDRERSENRELRRHIDKLERTVERLRARLGAAGLDVNGD